MYLKDMGKRIRNQRKKQRLSQQQLARRLGISPQAVSKWERGENAPDISLLLDLSTLLGVRVEWLLGSALDDHIKKAYGSIGGPDSSIGNPSKRPAKGKR